MTRVRCLAGHGSVMQDDEPRRRHPRSQSATATEALNTTPDAFVEQQHPTLSAPCRGHLAGAQRPPPPSPPPVQRRPGAGEARTQQVVSSRHQRPLQPAPVTQRHNTTGQQNPVSLQSVQGRAAGTALDADRVRYVDPFSLTPISRLTRALPRQCPHSVSQNT